MSDGTIKEEFGILVNVFISFILQYRHHSYVCMVDMKLILIDLSHTLEALCV